MVVTGICFEIKFTLDLFALNSKWLETALWKSVLVVLP